MAEPAVIERMKAMRPGGAAFKAGSRDKLSPAPLSKRIAPGASSAKKPSIKRDWRFRPHGNPPRVRMVGIHNGVLVEAGSHYRRDNEQPSLYAFVVRCSAV